MIGRIAAAIGLGAAVTFGLLFLMQMLIASGRGLNADAERYEITDFVRVEREQRVEREENKPEKPPEPEEQPDMPNPDQNTDFDNSLAVSMSGPSINADVSIGGLGFGVSDGEYLPIVKVAPVYPTRAASRGLEGYVIVEFTVTETGSTSNIFVVESTSSLFERAAMDAASKFKYKPRVIDGNPVSVAGVRNKITFQLED
jgi:protein TonB